LLGECVGGTESAATTDTARLAGEQCRQVGHSGTAEQIAHRPGLQQNEVGLHDAHRLLDREQPVGLFFDLLAAADRLPQRAVTEQRHDGADRECHYQFDQGEARGAPSARGC